MKQMTFKASAQNQTGVSIIVNSSDTWANIVSAGAGTASSTATTYIGILNDGQYDLRRAFISFNTSALPDNAIIISATMYVCTKSWSATGISVSGQLFKWNSSDFVIDANAFDEFTNTLNHVSNDNILPSVVDNWYSWDFNTAGLLTINKTGTSGYIIRDLTYDYLVSAPANGQNSLATFYNSNDGATKVPYIEIEYYTPKPNWQSSGLITVTNSTGGTLTDFQVKIELDSTFPYSEANANGDDIRFSQKDSFEDYYYWIEKWNDGGDSIIWVKIDSLVNGDNTLKMWWNNSGASSESDGTNTFIAWDDFDDGYNAGDAPKTSRGWTVGGGSPTIENLGFSSMVLQLDADNSPLVSEDVNNIYTTTANVIVHYKIRITRTATNNLLYFSNYEGGTTKTTVKTVSDNTLHSYNGTVYGDYSPNFSWAADTWYEFEERFTSTVYSLKRDGWYYIYRFIYNKWLYNWYE